MGQYDVDEIEFYSNGWLDNIDLASVTNDELKDLTYYQVKQATGTYNEMVSMEESDPDYAFWDNDYNNEKNNYMQLAAELNNRGIEVPHALDMHDNASQLNNVIERFTISSVNSPFPIFLKKPFSFSKSKTPFQSP